MGAVPFNRGSFTLEGGVTLLPMIPLATPDALSLGQNRLWTELSRGEVEKRCQPLSIEEFPSFGPSWSWVPLGKPPSRVLHTSACPADPLHPGSRSCQEVSECSRVLNPDQVVGYLKALVALNSGTNQAMDYSLIPLTPCGSLEDSLNHYFARLHGKKKPSPLETTQIQPLADIKPLLRSWLFVNFGAKRDDALASFMKLLSDCLDWTDCYRVIGHAPSSYDCSYDDIAFTTRSGYWLLHLGVSD